MIFRQWQQVLDGTKTQTRRLQAQPPHIGRTYAVQPGCGKPAVGRIRIISIRQERLQEISEDDVLAEGVELQTWAWPFSWPRTDSWPRTAGYAQLWNSIYTKPGTRWQDNPPVWVLEFELVEGHAR